MVIGGAAKSSADQLLELQEYKSEAFVTHGCDKIKDYRFDALVGGLIITVTVLTLNAVMQEIITRSVVRIGYDSNTIEIEKIKFYMFLILFFNTSIVMCFVGANLER